MVSTFTPNIQLEEPARGDQVGTWDTPVNANTTLIDLTIGGIATINLNNSPVILASGQFQCSLITFSSTLTGNVAITFPTSFIKSYKIRNTCTGSSAFIITLGTTAAATKLICPPPGETIEVFSDGTSLTYTSFPHIGSYWDFVGSSVPNWVSGCTVAPWLAATGGTFSATTFPVLAITLGSTTLPDTRGRARFALDGGAGRLSSAVAGFNPNAVGTGGGDQNIPVHTHGVTDPGHPHTASFVMGVNPGTGDFAARGVINSVSENVTVNSNMTGLTVNSAGTGTAANVPPAYIGGITMIRAG
jgi:hypothetical protein